MHNVNIGVVASVLSEETGKKEFLSAAEDTYHPIETILPNNDLDIEYNISLLISKYTSINKDFAHMSTFLDIIKHNNNIWIYYAVALPSEIEIKDCYRLSQNICIINPLVRKAIKYV